MSYLYSSPYVSTKPWIPLPERFWTEPERWVWERVRRGHVADFNERYDTGENKPLDPKERTAWANEKGTVRKIRSDFLQTILLHDPWSKLITDSGVVIGGALFSGKIDFCNAEIFHPLLLEFSLFEDGFDFSYSHLNFGLSLAGSCFHGEPDRKEKSANECKLVSFCGPSETSLRGAKIGIQLNLSDMLILGDLVMDNAFIEGNFYMRCGEIYKTILPGMRVDGQMIIDGSCFDRFVVMERLIVSKDMHMRNTSFEEYVDLSYATIGGNILCEGATFSKPEANRMPTGVVCDSLYLTDATVDVFYDGKTKSSPGVWPKHINIDRFYYNHLRGTPPGSAASEDLTDRRIRWFKIWLGSQKDYSPSPYQHCAKVLREAGQPNKAKEILFFAKEREKYEACKNGNWVRWLILVFLKWVIGYGLGWRFKMFPFVWALFVLVAGALICFYSPDPPNAGEAVLVNKKLFWWCFGLSLDRLLPLVQFCKDYTDYIFQGWQRAWFIGQTLFGWALALFIAAGLAGVGKPGGRD